VSGPRSAEWFARAGRLFPGGVNSPVRAFGAVGGAPFVAARGEGARLYDVDGRSYIDYVLSWGALILGHAHPRVTAAAQAAVAKGAHYGTPTPEEVELGERIVACLPSVERIRFVNSGTEATMSAVRLARAVTGRDRILKFDGAYHGHADAFLVRAGSGVATLGLPGSPGVPDAWAALTLVVPFNDLDAVADAFRRHPRGIAAVIVEPVMGNCGLVPPEPGFLEGLREWTEREGALLIFDEVMTGFRVALGGAQGRFGVRPDLTTLGKVIGAGFPVGAYGGRAHLMARVAPEGDVYQAGTLSGNPVAMAAGAAQLAELLAAPPYEALEARGRRLAEGIVGRARARGVDAWGTALGGLWGVHFVRGPVRRYADAQGVDRTFFARFFRACLARGVFLPPSPFEASFLSTAHGDAEIDATLAAVEEALDEALR
jgi:glutamate-1-semialdehyde 2,1-aminomutase